jgi:hypothetical protein
VAWQDFLLGTAGIRERLDPQSFYTNELVDRFNAFDASKIRAHARAFQP